MTAKLGDKKVDQDDSGGGRLMRLVLRSSSNRPHHQEACGARADSRRAVGRAVAASLLLAGHLAAGATEARAETAGDDHPMGAASPVLDRSEAEELIYQYLAQDLPFLVGMLYRAEYLAELKADPPRFDAEDRYHFNPPSGILEFRYDGERGGLIVRAAIHRYRGRQQGHGLSFEQISEAVHRYGKDGASLGGGRLDTAPKLDGVFLRRDFVGPPRSARQFARQVDDLVKAANRWSRKHYLRALKAYALTLAPPASATAEADGFRATMALTDNAELYGRIWSRPPGAVQPWHISVHEAKPGTELVLAIHIVDPAIDSEGLARVEATTRLFGPDGVERGTPSEVILWHQPPPPAGHFQLTDRPISVGFAATEPEGSFRVLAEVCDRVAEKCVQLTHTVAIVKGPGAAPSS